jgi:ribonuclease HI
MKDENTIKTRIRILTNENHPTRSQMLNRNIYDHYAMKPGSPKPFFIRAAELLGQMDIDRRKVEKTPDYIRTPWYKDDRKSMDWSLCKMKKGTQKEIHTRIYIDGSKKEEKVRYAVVTDQQSTRRKIRDINIQRGTRSHHRRNTEATDNGGQRSDIYWPTKHHDPKTRNIRQLMDKRKGNVTQCWVPKHAGITGKKDADEEAKRALEESISNDENYPPEDLIGWIKRHGGQPTKNAFYSSPSEGRAVP